MGTFSTFACDKSMIGMQDFANTLDVFAEMDTDNKDISLTLKPKPLKLLKVGHQRHDRLDLNDISSFDFEIDPNPIKSPRTPRLEKQQIRFREH